jgi:hypothetical protein
LATADELLTSKTTPKGMTWDLDLFFFVISENFVKCRFEGNTINKEFKRDLINMMLDFSLLDDVYTLHIVSYSSLTS